jgi:hypothetical protein
MTANEQRWVVQPDDARIEIAIGREAKLSPDVQEALDSLMRALEAEQDVQGYLNCQEVEMGECRSYFSCAGVTQ